eukprot:Blabericola_migrator_1__12205@NODE_758_length_6631_cov_135_724863_g542_i0_p5_GENE_NODE_758_length_6631_cov_135_724863_g542_i0NODE_758_length_6631_cov_135_724863_g542_i0_p5_ORF_typecomplete_len213_score13_21_NODE_758_length_6631_cov_135_724863_g542_i036804318
MIIFQEPCADFSSVGKLPLALFGYLLGLTVILYILYQIACLVYLEVNCVNENDDGSLEFSDWLTLGVLASQGTATLIGLTCIAFRIKKGAAWIHQLFEMVSGTIKMQTASQWIGWTVGMVQGSSFSQVEIGQMIATTVFNLSLLITKFYTCSALRSLAAVLEVGGSGWEYMNHVQVRGRQFQDLLYRAKDTGSRKNLRSSKSILSTRSVCTR